MKDSVALCVFFCPRELNTTNREIKMISGRAPESDLYTRHIVKRERERERKETSDGAIIIVVHDERDHISREQRLKSSAISDAVWVPTAARPAELIFF